MLHPCLFGLGKTELKHGMRISGVADMVTEAVMQSVNRDNFIVSILNDAPIVIPKSHGRGVFLGATDIGIQVARLDNVREIFFLFLQGIFAR